MAALVPADAQQTYTFTGHVLGTSTTFSGSFALPQSTPALASCNVGNPSFSYTGPCYFTQGSSLSFGINNFTETTMFGAFPINVLSSSFGGSSAAIFFASASGPAFGIVTGAFDGGTINYIANGLPASAFNQAEFFIFLGGAPVNSFATLPTTPCLLALSAFSTNIVTFVVQDFADQLFYPADDTFVVGILDTLAPSLPTSCASSAVAAQISSNGGTPATDFNILPSNADYPLVSASTMPLRISCVDKSTQTVVKNCSVSIQLTPPAVSSVPPDLPSGGHEHASPNRPTGVMSAASGSTGTSGFLDLVYTAPEISGDVTGMITGHDQSLNPITPTQFTIHVGISGLQQLGSIQAIALTGQKPIHPLNHFGLSGLNTALQSVATTYMAHFTQPTLPFAVNDTSLPRGGLFDISALAGKPWTFPHKRHRKGTSADIGSGSFLGINHSFTDWIAFQNRLYLLYQLQVNHLQPLSEQNADQTTCIPNLNSTFCSHWHVELN